jgi:hypothetical protein
VKPPRVTVHAASDGVESARSGACPAKVAGRFVDVRLRYGMARPVSTTRRSRLVAFWRPDVIVELSLATLTSVTTPRTPISSSVIATITSTSVKPALPH